MLGEIPLTISVANAEFKPNSPYTEQIFDVSSSCWKVPSQFEHSNFRVTTALYTPFSEKIMQFCQG